MNERTNERTNGRILLKCPFSPFSFVFFFSVADQGSHTDILDMAAVYKFEVQRHRLTSQKEREVDDEEVTVSIMADLQEEQDKESERIMTQLQEKVRNSEKQTNKQTAP